MKKRPPAVSFESILLYTRVFSLTKQDQALKIPSAIDQILPQKKSWKWKYFLSEMALKKESHFHILKIS